MRKVAFPILVLAIYLSPLSAQAWPRFIDKISKFCSEALSGKPLGFLDLHKKLEGANSLEEIFVYSYLLNESAATNSWDWKIKVGTLRIQFTPNNKAYNNNLLALGRLLYYYSEGKLFIDRDKPDSTSKNLLLPRESLPPKYRLAMNAKRSQTLNQLPSSSEDQALIDLATLEVTQSPVGDPTVHLFDVSRDLVVYADRLAYLAVESDFNWLELRWNPRQLQAMKDRVESALEKYGKE